MPRRPFISTVPTDNASAEASIVAIACGRASMRGSRPSTRIPAKLTRIASPVRQPTRSPSHHPASKVVIGT